MPGEVGVHQERCDREAPGVVPRAQLRAHAGGEDLGYPAEACYFSPRGTAGSLGKKASELSLERAFRWPPGGQSEWRVEGPEEVGRPQTGTVTTWQFGGGRDGRVWQIKDPTEGNRENSRPFEIMPLA